MYVTSKILLLVFLVLTLTTAATAKDWRGIAPLRSTRQDVEKLLGPAQPPQKGWFFVMHKGFSMYFLDEGVVRVDFAENETPNSADCLKAIPAGTVLLITVMPKKGQTIADLSIDVRSFRRFNPSLGRDPEYDAYYNERQGLIVSTHKGSIKVICYMPGATDKRLCRSYYRKPKAFVEVRDDWF